jgi:hypothetical protein
MQCSFLLEWLSASQSGRAPFSIASTNNPNGNPRRHLKFTEELSAKRKIV